MICTCEFVGGVYGLGLPGCPVDVPHADHVVVRGTQQLPHRLHTPRQTIALLLVACNGNTNSITLNRARWLSLRLSFERSKVPGPP